MGISVIAPAVGFGRDGQQSVVVPPTMRGPDGQKLAELVRSLDIPLPELIPIPDAHEFNQEGDKATVAPETGIAITGLSVDIPQGYRAVIRGVSIYITNMLATTNVTFSVLLNGPGTSPAGYQGLKIFPRVAPFVGNSFDSMIRITGPAMLSGIYTNIDGGSYQVGMALSGWLWNIASEDRWKSRGP